MAVEVHVTVRRWLFCFARISTKTCVAFQRAVFYKKACESIDDIRYTDKCMIALSQVSDSSEHVDIVRAAVKAKEKTLLHLIGQDGGTAFRCYQEVRYYLETKLCSRAFNRLLLLGRLVAGVR